MKSRDWSFVVSVAVCVGVGWLIVLNKPQKCDCPTTMVWVTTYVNKVPKMSPIYFKEHTEACPNK